MNIFVNSKRFETVFSDYLEKNAKVKIADELNRRAASIIMKAIEETPQANRDSIKRELGAMQIIRQRVLKSGKRMGQLTKPKSFYRADIGQNKVFKIFNWRRKFRADSLPERLRGKPTGNKKMKGFADKFVKAVRSSCGYIAAGWLPALRVFLEASSAKTLKANEASKNLQKRFKLEKNKYAKAGYGNPANPTDVILQCTFGNAARGAEKIAKEPLIRAINREIDDMKMYIEGKIMGLSGKEIARLANKKS